jgi:hypothetical protein
MQKLLRLADDIAQAFARFAGRDIFIERATEGGFRRVRLECGSREYYGLGLHVIVSPLQMPNRQ